MDPGQAGADQADRHAVAGPEIIPVFAEHRSCPCTACIPERSTLYQCSASLIPARSQTVRRAPGSPVADEAKNSLRLRNGPETADGFRHPADRKALNGMAS